MNIPSSLVNNPYPFEDSPSLPKVRRVNLLHAAMNASYPPPYVRSPSDSPNICPHTPERQLRNTLESTDVMMTANSSDACCGDRNIHRPQAVYLSTPIESPNVRSRRYRREEFWKAIKPDYQYIMNGGIFEACKSTESDLSWDNDGNYGNKTFSFTEFHNQYDELMNWCNKAHVATNGTGLSLSERYLNQVYREEMLKHSPRKRCLISYAEQLLKRYPNMKTEINRCMQNLNEKWDALMSLVVASNDVSRDKVIHDIEQDLSQLQAWLECMEGKIPLCIRPNWGNDVLKGKLCQHQALQLEIESHTRTISAVLKLCERIEKKGTPISNNQSLAVNLERRWHTIWLQSLEWQCRLEYAINQKKNNSSHSWSVDYTLQLDSLKSPNLNFDHIVDESHDPDIDFLVSLSENGSLNLTGTDIGANVTPIENVVVEEKTFFPWNQEPVLPEVEKVDKKRRVEVNYCRYRRSENQSYDEFDLTNQSLESSPTEIVKHCHVQMGVYSLLHRTIKSDFISHDGNLPNMNMSVSQGDGFHKIVFMDSDSEKIRCFDGETRCSSSANPPLNTYMQEKPLARFGILLTMLQHLMDASATFQKYSGVRTTEFCRRTTEYEVKTFLQNYRSRFERIKKWIIKAETVELPWHWRTNHTTPLESDDSCDASGEFTESEMDDCTGISDTEYVQLCLHCSNQSARTMKNGTFISSLCTDIPGKRIRTRSYEEQRNSEKSEFSHSFSEDALADSRKIDVNTSEQSSRIHSPRRDTLCIKRPSWSYYSERLVLSQSSSERTANIESGGICRRTGFNEPVKGIEPFSMNRTGISKLPADYSDYLADNVESFSETAWDDHQNPLYGSVNSSYVDENLDDEYLQWLASSNLEFDEDFSLSPPMNWHTHGKHFPLTSTTLRLTDGSDSDQEDIQYVLDESRKQLHIAGDVLQRIPHYDMETDISINPLRYAELLATCQTNIRCLQDVCETLQERERDVSLYPNFVMFKEMIALWTKNYQIAFERQEASRLLSCILRSLQAVQKTIGESTEIVTYVTLDDKKVIEEYIGELQKQKIVLEERQLGIDQLLRSVDTFRLEYMSTHMDKFSVEITNASQTCRTLGNSLSSHLVQLQSTLSCVYEYHESKKDIHYCLEKEISLLNYVEWNEYMYNGADKKRTCQDIQTLLDDLHVHEEKMVSLHHFAFSVSRSRRQDQIHADTAILTQQLEYLKQRCHDLLDKCGQDQKEAAEKIGTVTPRNVFTQTVERAETRMKRNGHFRLKRLVSLTLPIQCGLIFLYGLLCLGDLTLSPQLRHISGPPPF